MIGRHALIVAANLAFVAVHACSPVPSTGRVPDAQPPASVPAKDTSSIPESARQFEVLVQYRDDADEPQKAAVRASVSGRVKERLDSPSGARNLEVLLVPETSALDSMERVVAALRRHKAVRIAEGQQTYTRQPSSRD